MGKVRGTFVVPRAFDPEAKRFATIVNDSIAQIKGEKGDPLDAAVTFRDLIDTGIAKRDIKIGSTGNIVGTNSINIIPGDEEVLDTPAVPTGLSASGAFQNIIIEWDDPTFFGFSHVEIWAATSNSFANRSFVGQTTANVFNHQVGTNQTRYYWIRHVNTQGVAGPFNSTTGTQASTTLINTTDINDGLITSAKLVDSAVTEVKIATSAITETKISSNAVTSNKIAANAVIADKIASNSITSAKMVAGTITAASGIIGDLAISSAKIIDGAIINAKIGNLAVDTGKIAALAITTAKIADGNITTAKIGDAQITTAKIGDAQITNAKINDLSAEKIDAGTLNANRIASNSITANKINVTDLVLPTSGGLVSGSTIGNFNTNSKRFAFVTNVGSGAGFYQGYVRLIGGTGQVKTISMLFSDGTHGASSAFQINTTETSGGTDILPLTDNASNPFRYPTPLLEKLPGLIADSRLTSSSDTANIPIAFRYTGSGTVKLFIHAQGNSNSLQIGSCDARFVKFSSS